MITVEDVKRTAFLARIRLNDEEASKIHRDIAETLGWMRSAFDADTKNLEPLVSVMEDVPMPMRPDVVTEGGAAAVIVDTAPVREETFFVVPKMVE